ncbi:putative tricarboxylic transport membrane protein [Evansella vedderi]|uniref:Tricarboxylic transport membrane protein n=1 Tax=Evansella vedderi TaxID=38282 RepID=A0ABT9ZV18_9BACI|nr:tripartite tricarboxylate transporter permease [Evansella vedderi]MDQ0255088.1 putative tricarboxylic transport membrane protein [Evansella vedderi]
MEYLWHIFEFHHLFVLALGLFLGILVGALPGLTPTMGVALMIPFTFSLGPTEGLIILGGIYCGSVFGGSIPAILFNVPGAPASVATTFDGYPMTQKGEGRKALELATIASVVGGLFGIFLLLFFAPVFSNFSLQFGPVQTFWIAIFGITVIAAISEGSTSKNLIGGCIGILLSFIGISTVTGTARFTFGMDSLIGGLHIVAVLIGLFALPQAFRLMERLPLREKVSSPVHQTKKSSIRESFGDVLKRPKAVSIGSGLGAFIGMIPGAGGNIASILAYNEAKRFSKDKSKFGKGEKDGVIVSESANNAMVGGSLIPLLTLGIPGSPTAAIFLGGLLIHGIWPGRNLFVDNADVAYTFLFSMVAAQILLLFLGLGLIKYMTRLTHIPIYIMAPVIIAFSIIGAYATQNNVFDIYTVVILGIFMFWLQKYNFAPAPIALGFILGSIAEEGFLQGLQLGGAQGSALVYFFSGTWNILLSSLTALTILISIYTVWKKRREKRKDSNMGLNTFKWENFLSKKAVIWMFIGMVNVVSIYMLFDLPFQQRIFPQVTLLFFMIFVLIELMKGLKGVKEEYEKFTFNLSVFLLMIFVTVVSLLTNVIGFYTQVLILMLAVPLLVYYKNWNGIKLKNIFIIGCSFTLMLYVIFTILLKVPLPGLF